MTASEKALLPAQLQLPPTEQIRGGGHELRAAALRFIHPAISIIMPSLASTTSPAPSCELYDKVIDMNWEAVANHAKECPQDAAFIDGEWKETPLFNACQHDPSEDAIKALVKAYPAAVRMGSKNGDLPLHIACRWRASENVIRALIESDPTTACALTKFGKTPLGALWEGYRKSDESEEMYQSTCEKSKVVLEAIAREYEFVSSETPNEPLGLFAAMKMECTDALLYFVFQEYRHQIAQRDVKGRLALHIAADLGIPTQRKLWKCVFEELLEHYPEAARIPDPTSSRLPLHTMISNPAYGWAEIEVVFQAYPQAMLERESETGLLPFALTSSVETSFCLLTAQPDVLSSCRSLRCQEESRKGPSESKRRCGSDYVFMKSAVLVGVFSAFVGFVATATMSSS